jgi:hypothetical protein
MGISPTSLRMLRSFKEKGWLEGVREVFELGAQNIYAQNDSELVQLLLEAFGKPRLRDEELAQLCDMGTGKTLWTLLGAHHVSIDSSGSDGALPLDLNFDQVPPKHAGHYDLVTNFGTTEHIANQLNAFKVIHDLTHPGGLMYHEVPFTGWVNHGLVSYTPRFFWMLCRSNLYKYMQLWIEVFPERSYLHPDILSAAQCSATEENFSHQRSIICCMLRKEVDAKYVPPFDGDLTGLSKHDKERYWTLKEKDV